MPGGRSLAPSTRRTGKRGRPSSLTPETVKLIETEILKLGSNADAALAGGIHPDTFNKWLSRGNADYAAGRDTDYGRFYETVEKASQKIKAILRVRVLSDRSPKTALKVLAARWPDEWGPKIQIEDKTPAKKQSPREKFMERLESIEQRQTEAGKALAQFAKALGGEEEEN